MEVENEKDDPLKESFEVQKQLTRIYVNSVRGYL